ncbi:helix-turn-helix domain-containing protein [Nocardioides sp. InS609-2]|uniref:helix-turn-helix domain-containing protein n=1 Tax=Nocardioides sp. InS609-2 TaxID=2760705 RepID=UPI0020C1604D|nr:helix-turn-helix domain-containing protein [Nocardioides sp. InS609-2]
MKANQIWLTTRQAGERADRHPETVRRACEAGDLHGGQTVPGRSSWRIHIDCLDAWVLGQPCPHVAAKAS